MAEEIKNEEVKEVKVKKTSSKKSGEAKSISTKKASTKKTSTAKKTAEKKEVKKEEVKETKKAKKEVVETKKRSEATAKVLGLKVTPRKVRLVIDLVRGKDVDEAIQILSLVHKEAAPYIIKLLNSAKANATNNFNMDGDKLYIASIMASDSIKMKRYLPRAKGSASGLVKRFSNVFVTLKEKELF